MTQPELLAARDRRARPSAMRLPAHLVSASVTVGPNEAKQRLDELLTRWGYTKRDTRRLSGCGRIRVDGRAVTGSPRLAAGQFVEVLTPQARPAELAEQIPLSVLAQTEELLLVDKPGRMAICPGPGRPAGTLANALRGLGCPLSQVEGPLRPGIVHRLDAGTSGVMVVAKTDPMHRRLCRLFHDHLLERRYLALVEGEPPWVEREVEQPIGRKRPGRKALAVSLDGKTAQTRFRVVERWAGLALVEARPATGRTHQIRVHLAWLGHPVCGDTLYGGGYPAARRAAALGVHRTALHAAELSLASIGVKAAAPLPADLAEALGRLRGEA